MTHEQMLQALQDDVDDWPAAVKAAGVKIASGSAYQPGRAQQRGPPHAGRPAGDLRLHGPRVAGG